MKAMLEEVKYCQKVRREHFNNDMVMTTSVKVDFRTAKKCHICDKQNLLNIQVDAPARCHEINSSNQRPASTKLPAFTS